MRFPTVFRRRVGERPEGAPALPAIGSDRRPTGKPDPKDNFHTSRLVNFNGFPAQRVCVGVSGPEIALGQAVPVELYMYEDQTDAWLLVPGDRKVAVGSLAYFDAPCLLFAGRSRKGDEDDSHDPGSLDVVLVPSLDGANLPDGEYAFVVGTDVSNPGR